MAIYSCNQCNKTFSHETNLMRHIQGFHENKILECEVCGFKTPRKDTLKSHKVAKHGNANKPNLISINSSSTVTEVTIMVLMVDKHIINPWLIPLHNLPLCITTFKLKQLGIKKTTYRDAGIQAQPKQREIDA